MNFLFKRRGSVYSTSYTLQIRTRCGNGYNIKIRYMSDGSVFEEHLNSPIKDGNIVTEHLIIPANDIASFVVKDYIKVRVA